MDETPPSSLSIGLWPRLRRRKVVQWALVYVAVAWGLLQALGFVADAFGWPAATKQVATIVTVLGLAIVIALAWYHGDRGQQRVTAVEASILVALCLAGGLLALRYARPSLEVSRPRIRENSAPTATPGAHPSIAVLDFANRSASVDDASFVEGVHDDILMQLTKIGSMTVIASSSVASFRGKSVPMHQLAEALGATNLLEGGVQRAGDRIRLHVRLVDARRGTQLWAESYDRELTATNLFAIQSEVATSIAAALAAALTPAERTRVGRIPTVDLNAWESYQAGEQRLARRTQTSLRDARVFFQRAIDRDPRFALAYAGLANAIWLEADYSGTAVVPAQAEAAKIIERALALEPDLAEALTTKAKLLQDQRRLDEAEPLYRKAIALKPSYPQVYMWYAQLLDLQDRPTEAVASMQRAAELDPMSVFVQTYYAAGLSGRGHFAESVKHLERARDIDPKSPLPWNGLGNIQAMGYGRIDLAIPLLRESVRLGAAPRDLARAWLDVGDLRSAESILRNQQQDTNADATSAYIALARGDDAAAVRHAQAAVDIEPKNWQALAVLRDYDLRSNRAAAAVMRYARGFPELAVEDRPRVDTSNYGPAIDFAVVLQKTGAREHAQRLLELAEGQVAKEVRLGVWGYGVADVSILAMRGERARALQALQDAVNAHWRGPYWRYERDQDPALAAIRDAPEFKAAFAIVERDMAEQLAAIRAADRARKDTSVPARVD